MSEQGDFFSNTEGAIAAKTAAMVQVEANANEAWKDGMFKCVETICREQFWFTSDDVFDLAAARNIRGVTHDLRAFGPVMMRAAKAKLCRKANCAPVNSKRKSRHAAPLAVWESLIFERPQNAR